VCVLAPTDAHTERTRGGRAVVLMKRLFVTKRTGFCLWRLGELCGRLDENLPDAVSIHREFRVSV
jgi:hypothetical protein